MSLSEFVEGKAYKNVMKFVYGWGASIVLLGALFKIMHWPGGGIMLTIGMSTEVIIFFLSAFEPLHEEVDWTLVYPELAGMTDDFEPKDRDERDRRGRGHYHDDRLINLSEMPPAHTRVSSPEEASRSFSVGETFGSGLQGLKAIEQFDSLLAQADLTPEMFQKLGEGIHKVGDIAQKFSQIDQTIEATGEFSQKLTNASKSVGNLAQSCQDSADTIKTSVSNLSSAYNYSSEIINNTSQQVAGTVRDGIKTMVGALNDAGAKLIQSIGNSDQELRAIYQSMIDQLNEANKNIKQYSENYIHSIETQNKNLSSINSIYELHIQNIAHHSKIIEELTGKGAKMVEHFNEGLEQSVIYREEMKRLNEQLSQLNQIYGSMLSTVTINE